MRQNNCVWVATWYGIDGRNVYSDEFETRGMALNWVGDRYLVCLVQVYKGVRDGDDE